MPNRQPFELTDRDWGAVLNQAAAADHSELHIICPFIKRGMSATIGIATNKLLAKIARDHAVGFI
jgi:nucleotidyltransferase/DNA polymerase involved in DNA repair